MRRTVRLYFGSIFIGLLIIFSLLNRGTNNENDSYEGDIIRYDSGDDQIRRFKINYTVLNESYYTLQTSEINRLLKSASLQKPLCFDNLVKIRYTLCPYKNDHMVKAVKEQAWNVDHAERIIFYLQNNPGAGYIDVGTNMGTVVLPVLRTLRSNAPPVIMVEPNYDNIKSLLLGMQQNGLLNLTHAIIPRALWTTVDENMKWFAGAQLTENDGLNSSNGIIEGMYNLSNFNLPPATGIVRHIKTATFDSHVLPVALAMGIRTAIMKIDIEGAECMAWQSAKKFLININVLYILTEYWPALGHHKNWDCLQKMFNVFKRFKYVPFRYNSRQVGQRLHWNFYKKWPDFDMIWKKVL